MKEKSNFLTLNLFRNSRPEVFCKKGVIWNFAKFTGKHLYRVSFLVKLQAWGIFWYIQLLWNISQNVQENSLSWRSFFKQFRLQVGNLMKKIPLNGCFKVNFSKSFKTTFWMNTCKRLYLKQFYISLFGLNFKFPWKTLTIGNFRKQIL